MSLDSIMSLIGRIGKDTIGGMAKNLGGITQGLGGTQQSQTPGLFDNTQKQQGGNIFADIVGFGVNKLKESPLGQRLANAGLGEKNVGEVGKNLFMEAIFPDEKGGGTKQPAQPRPTPQQPAQQAQTPVLPMTQQRPQQQQQPQIQTSPASNRAAQLLAQQKALREQLGRLP